MGNAAESARTTRGERTGNGRPRKTARAAPAKEPAQSQSPGESARDRFLGVDSYRADREWARYEGTPQRELFRELRERFLERHRSDGPWALEIGPGPGRFTARIGGAKSRRVLIDLSDVMLRRAAAPPAHRSGDRPIPDPVKGDGFQPPVRDGAFDEVAALGNVIGFAPEPLAGSLDAISRLAAPGGRLILEIVPGTGERSRYLARLPPRAVGRLLRSPVRAVLPRIDREGFAPVEGREVKDHEFRRRTVGEIVRALTPSGWSLREAMAVAPALGFDPERIAMTRPHANGWIHLLEIEEAIGRLPERWERSAALMLALDRSGRSGGTDAL